MRLVRSPRSRLCSGPCELAPEAFARLGHVRLSFLGLHVIFISFNPWPWAPSPYFFLRARLVGAYPGVAQQL
jgi:hypothetical protein